MSDMKKVWILEKFMNADELRNTLAVYELAYESHKGSDSEEEHNVMKALEKDIEKLKAVMDEGGKWVPKVVKANYYTFVTKAKDILRNADESVIADLRKALGKTPYSEEIKAMYKDAHASVRSSYRVVEAEVPSESIATIIDYDVTKVNTGVYSYLWSSLKR